MRFLLTVVLFAVHAQTAVGQVSAYGEELRQLTIEYLPKRAMERDNWPLFIRLLNSSQAIFEDLREEADAHSDDLFLDFMWDLRDASEWEEEDQLGGLTESQIKILKKTAPDGVMDSWGRPLAPRDDFQRLADKGLRHLEAEGVLDALASLAVHPYGIRPPHEGSPESWFLPELGLSRVLTRAIAYRGRRAIARGDAQTVAECYRQIDALSTIMHFQAFPYDRGVAFSNESRALVLVERAAMAGIGAQGLLDELKRSVPHPPLTMYFKGERILLHAGVATLIKELQAGGETFRQPDPDTEGLAASVFKFFTGRTARVMATPEQLHAGVDRLIDEYLEIADLPRSERSGRIAETKESFKEDRRLFILAPFTGPPTAAIRESDSHTAQANGVMVLLAIEAYRAKHGRLPNSLDDLTPEILEALPHDPFAPDGRFRYLRHPDGEGTYVLYSVGRDGVDNQGHLPDSANRRWDAFSRSTLEADFVFGMVD